MGFQAKVIMQKGFTLIEIMVAVLVVVLGVLPVYYLLTSGTRGVRWSIRQVKAVNHCSAILELFKGLKYRDIKKLTDNDRLSANQKGYMVYSQEDEQWRISADLVPSAQWVVDTGSSDAQKFFTKLSPSQTGELEILPALEAYFSSRSIDIDCSSKSVCVIACEVKWQRHENSDNKGDHQLKFSTVVTDSKSGGDYGQGGQN